MATLSQEAPKRWRILFMDVTGTGKRKQIRLYNVTKKQAESHYRHIENIVSARLQGVRLDDPDAAWLGSLPQACHARVVKAGLAEPRVVDEATTDSTVAGVTAAATNTEWTVGSFLDDHYNEGRETGCPGNAEEMECDDGFPQETTWRRHAA